MTDIWIGHSLGDVPSAPPAPLRVLLIEDSESDAMLILAELRRAGFDPSHGLVWSAEALAEALKAGPWDLLISDCNMPCFSGLEALAMVKERGLDLPFIMVSGALGEESAVEAMKAGAHDYLMKDQLARLGPAARRELAEAEVRRRRAEAEEALKRAYEDLERRVHERTAELYQAHTRVREELEERKRLEEERNRMFVHLLRGQKLQAIGQLAAGVAHEINNPVGWILSNLNSIEGYVRSLADVVKRTSAAAFATSGPEAGRLQKELARIREGTDVDFLLKDSADAVRESKEGAIRIRDIVAGLKAFARSDDKEPEARSLAEILEQAIKLSGSELKYKATVVREFAEVPPIACRPGQLEQVFINLLVNAAQAIPARGEIRVGLAREAREAVVRIRDTGAGIAPEFLPRLFEPFFTTKPVGKGTGLGLHVAHKIVRAHGGKIRVDSKVGMGTEVTVCLPLPRAAWDVRAIPAGGTSGGKPLVVLVDDDPYALNGLRRVLLREPLQVLSTRDPRKALEWVDHRSVRLIVSDHRMPDMTGTSLLEEVARCSPETRRLMVTAYPDCLEVVNARGGAVEEVIPKPWDEQILREAVRGRLNLSVSEGR